MLSRHYGRGGWSEDIVAGPAEACTAGIRAVADAGAELILLNPLLDDAQQLERLAAEAIRRSADLGVARLRFPSVASKSQEPSHARSLPVASSECIGETRVVRSRLSAYGRAGSDPRDECHEGICSAAPLPPGGCSSAAPPELTRAFTRTQRRGVALADCCVAQAASVCGCLQRVRSRLSKRLEASTATAAWPCERHQLGAASRSGSNDLPMAGAMRRLAPAATSLLLQPDCKPTYRRGARSAEKAAAGGAC